MNNIVNKEVNPWIRPWDMEKFDDLYNRDERFFSVLMKGVINWLNRNIIMYGKPINHFIFNTGSSIMFVESNGYEFSWNETTGEDQMYMHLPRCVINIEGISIPKEELTNPFARGSYERRDGNFIRGYNAEIRRLPIEMSLSLEYVLSNYNESIVLLQEILDKIIFQKYFNITYLGQIIRCSIEFSPDSTKIEYNKIDMSSPEDKNRRINLSVTVCSNYPIINTRSEISTDKIIAEFSGNFNVVKDNDNEQVITDTQKYNINQDNG